MGSIIADSWRALLKGPAPTGGSGSSHECFKKVVSTTPAQVTATGKWHHYDNKWCRNAALPVLLGGSVYRVTKGLSLETCKSLCRSTPTCEGCDDRSIKVLQEENRVDESCDACDCQAISYTDRHSDDDTLSRCYGLKMGCDCSVRHQQQLFHRNLHRHGHLHSSDHAVRDKTSMS